MPVQFTQDRVAFNFVIQHYNITNPDTAIFINKNNEQAVLTNDELNAVIQGKRVWEWLEYLYGNTIPPLPPETIIKELGELVYYYKVEGGN